MLPTRGIELILGPMGSGKTTEMLRRVRVHEVAGRTAVVVKHSIDTRYEDDLTVSGDAWKAVVTHNKEKREALHLPSLLPFAQTTEVDVIGIDEGQFFEDIVEGCLELVRRGKIVIVSGLDGTTKKEPFGRLLWLIPNADHVEKLRAVCIRCKQRDAPFTAKNEESTGKTVEVGGFELYSPVCRECWTEPESTKKVEVPPRDYRVTDSIVYRGCSTCNTKRELQADIALPWRISWDD